MSMSAKFTFSQRCPLFERSCACIFTTNILIYQDKYGIATGVSEGTTGGVL